MSHHPRESESLIILLTLISFWLLLWVLSGLAN